MLIIIGKTASGKDLAVSKLVSEYGYEKMVTYTTRPPREGEVDGVTYHYISEEEFLSKVEDGFFAEYKRYETAFGDWYYGSAKEEYEKDADNVVTILTPDGVRDVLNVLEKKPTVIYLYANIPIIKERLIKRRDDRAEAERRIEHDKVDFKSAPELADRIVYNNKGRNIDNVVNEIVDFIKK